MGTAAHATAQQYEQRRPDTTPLYRLVACCRRKNGKCVSGIDIRRTSRGTSSWRTKTKLHQNRTNLKAHQRGAGREGTALLQGLALCGRCGYRMHVEYCGSTRRAVYQCHPIIGAGACYTVPAKPLDEAVARLFLDVVKPPEIELGLTVVRETERQANDIDRQWALHLERAQYEARLAERRYKAIDPDNRVVARTLEREWNEKLEAIGQIERERETVRQREKILLTDADRIRILDLARNLSVVWNAPTTTHAERKNMLRMLVREVSFTAVDIPTRGTRVHVLWQTGAVSHFVVPRTNKFTVFATPDAALSVIRARMDEQDTVIARELNGRGLLTAPAHWVHATRPLDRTRDAPTGLGPALALLQQAACLTEPGTNWTSFALEDQRLTMETWSLTPTTPARSLDFPRCRTILERSCSKSRGRRLLQRLVCRLMVSHANRMGRALGRSSFVSRFGAKSHFVPALTLVTIWACGIDSRDVKVGHHTAGAAGAGGRSGGSNLDGDKTGGAGDRGGSSDPSGSGGDAGEAGSAGDSSSAGESRGGSPPSNGGAGNESDGGAGKLSSGGSRSDGGHGGASVGGSAGGSGTGGSAGGAGGSGTEKSGVIFQETWSLDGSPYILVGDVSIASLTIEAGVRVEAAGDYLFDVVGTLSAQGSAAQEIAFTTTAGNTGGWQGLRFDAAGEATLAHFSVEKSTAGGIRVIDSSPSFSSCFLSNNAAAQGGGLFVQGASSHVTLQNCFVENNVADDFFEAGGGVFVRDGATVTLTNSVLAHNGTVYANARGGALFMCGGQAQLLNAVVVENGASIYGNGSGGIAVNTGGLSGCMDASVNVNNSIVFGNVSFEIEGSSVSVDYSIVKGGYVGTGNLDANPVFKDSKYVLFDGASPCVDAGDPSTSANDTCFPPSLGAVRNDMGAYGGPGACGW